MVAETAFGTARLWSATELQAIGGHCWCVALPLDAADGDDPGDHLRSSLRLFEDGVELGPAHALHETIRGIGTGAFSHWGRHLFFSSSDGTDPRYNERRYDVLFPLVRSCRQSEILSAALAVPVETLTDEERYAWGERVFSAFVPEVHLSEYGRAFFDDRDFVTDYRRFTPGNYRSFDRKFALKELAKWAIGLDGDLAECGVFEGGSAYLIAKVLAGSPTAKRLHLFDSFAGLSEPTDRDGSYWAKGALTCELGRVQSNLAEFARSTSFYQGWIPERFHEVADCRFAFVHIDVDLYEPTRASLEFFGPRMVEGGIVVCDDYGFVTCPGARLAVDEYANELGLPVVHLPTGQGVLMFGNRPG